MLISESKLKDLIKEEATSVLLERDLRFYLSKNLTRQQVDQFHNTGRLPEELVEGFLDYLRKKGRKIAGTAALLGALMGPASAVATPASAPAAMAQVEQGATANIRIAADNVRKQLLDRFTSPKASEAFLNFTRSMSSPTFENLSDDEVKKYFNNKVAPKLIQVVKDIDVVDDKSKFPKDVSDNFDSNVQIGGQYDPKTDSIYMNPESFEKTGETDLKTITSTVMEEFQHAIDSNVTVGDLFPSLAGKPQADIQFAASKSLSRSMMGDIVSPDAKGDYVANPQEFYAKFQVIKSVLQEKHPDLFDAKGNIDKESLENVINMPRMYFDQGEVDFRIFDILQKDKSEKIKSFVDQLVKVQKTSPDKQIA